MAFPVGREIGSLILVATAWRMAYLANILVVPAATAHGNQLPAAWEVDVYQVIQVATMQPEEMPLKSPNPKVW